MAVLPSTEILDLRHVSARQMRPLLEAEATLWEQTLRWDYHSSTELLLEYLNGRVLPGFVTIESGEVTGFTFCVNEGHKAVVGDAFSRAMKAAIPPSTSSSPTWSACCAPRRASIASRPSCSSSPRAASTPSSRPKASPSFRGSSWNAG